ncbi:CPBP family intramembrane glutamic endopeptidase [Pseudooceanicola sp. MF1-13]|uniref:CPBP family intramembrane glutamic endopeptidase n=1 Tax=Pseudooceanicola sp. MF1-13 TaxID=3379095 RepID=UPI0038911EA6
MKAYAPHEALVEAARPSKALITTAVGFVAIEFLYKLGRDLLDFFLATASPDVADIIFDGVAPIAVLYDLVSFVILALLVVWVAWRSHDRGFASLVGPGDLAWQDLRLALIAASGMHVLMLFVVPWGLAEAEMQTLVNWLKILPVAMIALLIQTGAEELFYRGYLQQQLAARFRQTWVWMIVPNIAFAWVHWANGTDTQDSIYYVAWAFVFGLAASDLTARSGTLGAAIGFHLANNAFAFLIADTQGRAGSGLALYLFPMEADDWVEVADDMAEPLMAQYVMVDLMIVLVTWLVVRVAIRR